MPNLNLESLERLLALEESSFVVHGKSDDEGGDHIPIMQSLRSPTTRTLMYILENRNANKSIQAEFDLAMKEREATEELAREAEELLLDPLKHSFVQNLSTIFKQIKDDRGAGQNSDRAAGQNSDNVTDLSSKSESVLAVIREDALADDEQPLNKKRGAGMAVLGYTSQPNGRFAVIQAEPGCSDDISAVTQIGFTLPKNEAGTILPSSDEKSSVLSAASEKKERDESNRTVGDAVQMIPLHDMGSSQRNRFDLAAAPAADAKGTLQRLLMEQKQQMRERETSKQEYVDLMKGYHRWQDQRVKVFDHVLDTPVAMSAALNSL